jgi:Brp/Blh family beta-carotene 15,15'-monooxygenase
VPFEWAYLAICSVLLVALSLFGAPDLWLSLSIAAMLVAFVGVPHGGLDHWTGRRLLESRFAGGWWMMFFPGYLAVALAVAIAWVLFPVVTVITFFLLSAWHFGREDQQQIGRNDPVGPGSRVWQHLAAAATGGLVIWVPAWFRPEEMSSLLAAIMPGAESGVSDRAVEWTRLCGLVLLPMAAVVIFKRLLEGGREPINWVPLATMAISMAAPILLSFATYFALWHSVLGLSRLRSEEGLTAREFAIATLPLSILAVAGVIAAGWFFSRSGGASGQGLTPASLQTLFIGLSAIAVPHLILHEWSAYAGRASSKSGALS